MESFSQMQYSQYESSQNSQDLLQYSSGSEPQIASKLFEKYLSSVGKNCSMLKNTASVIEEKPDSENHSQNLNSRSNFYQQMQINKAMAKEKDDRDLANMVLQALKDWREEIRSSMMEIDNNIRRSTSSEKVSCLIEDVSKKITENGKAIICQLNAKETQGEIIAGLEKTLSKKDAQILNLNYDVENFKKFNDVVRQISSVVESQQIKTDEKLNELLIEVKKLEKFCEDLLKSQTDLEQVKVTLQEQIENSLKVQADRNFIRFFDEILQVKQCLNSQMQHFERFCNHHLENTKLVNKTDCSQINGTTNSFHANTLSQYNISPNSSKNQQAENYSVVHPQSASASLQNHLNLMQKTHQEEISRIRKELSDISEGLCSSVNINVGTNNEGLSVTAKNDRYINDTHRPAFFPSCKLPRVLSPLNWNSKKVLEKKTNPSPVATILPQQQQPTSRVHHEQHRGSFHIPAMDGKTEKTRSVCSNYMEKAQNPNMCYSQTHRKDIQTSRKNNSAPDRTPNLTVLHENSNEITQKRYMLRERNTYPNINNKWLSSIRNTPMRKVNTRKDSKPSDIAKSNQLSVDNSIKSAHKDEPREQKCKNRIEVKERKWDMKFLHQANSRETSPALSIATVLCQKNKSTYICSKQGHISPCGMLEKLDSFLNTECPNQVKFLFFK